MKMTLKQSIVRVVVASSLALASVAAYADTTPRIPHDHTPTVHSHTPTVHNRTETAHH
jgi:hypothetical protein